MKLPDTSISAYKEAQKGLIENHKERILEALERIGSGNYEQIARAANLDKIATMRRLSELERDLKVYKPGMKSKTEAGRAAYDYRLIKMKDFAMNLIGLSQGKLL